MGEILVGSHNPHKTDHILATGAYRIYDVEDEPQLADEQYLELNVGEGTWQGYLLPTGLPVGSKKRSRIIPTKDVVSYARTAARGKGNSLYHKINVMQIAEVLDSLVHYGAIKGGY